MFLEFSNNNGKRYIRVVESVRVTIDGKRVTRKKTIKNIGPVSRFTDGTPDFEDRLKASFLSGNPLIPELLPFVPKEQPLETYSFQITEGSDACIGHPKLFSHILLERILEELEVIQVMRSYKGFSKIQFDLLGYFRLLVYGRILDPASKISTAAQNEKYYEPIVDDAYKYHIYDTLDFIYDHKKQIFNRLNSVISKKFKRSTDIIYYDVTNFYFEIDEPDDDIVDENGNVIEKGTRKEGVSKENRKQPIVQMGLFLDDSGIPISYEIFPGNTLDHQTVRDSLKNTVDNMNFQRFLFVGDRGMCTYTNLLHILSQGNGYIVSKSIAKSKASEKAWIYDDSDYICESENFKYKSRIVTRTEKDENGKKHTITEKVVVYWDKYFHDRQEKENKSFLDFLDKLLESPHSFRITTSQSKSIRKFLKKEYLDIESGEMLQSSKLRTMIDKSKVQEYKQQMGYYQIVSSELHMSEKEIIEKYHGLSRIEDQFRVLKGDMSSRPMYVSTKEHIDAHLAICTIALIVMRILQNKIAESGLVKANPHGWSYGISAERVKNALNNWTVEMLPGDLYRFNNLDMPDLKLILDAFDIQIPKKLFRRQQLRSIKTSIKITN
ncbi:MAG: IS1634 family transposase [Eubacterium sp.]